MLSILLVLVTLYLVYLSAGHAAVRKLNLPLTALEKLVLAGLLSIATVAAVIAFSGMFVGSVSYYILVPFFVLGILEHTQLWKTLKAVVPHTRADWLVLFLGVLAVMSIGSTQFLSGIQRSDGILFQEIHDTMWHVSLGKALRADLPPVHPAIPSQELTQYHYFFDIFLATLNFTSQTSFVTLNYQISPIIVLTLLCASAYALGNRLTNRVGGTALLAVTAWGGSFAYMIPWFLTDHNWGESSFWVSQTFAMLVNPQVLFSFATVYAYLLLQLPAFRTKHWRHAIILPLVATSIGIKSYGWVVLSLLYAVDLLWEILQTRSVRPIGIGLLYLCVTAPFFWVVTRFDTSQTFFYQPLWFIDTMVEAPDRLNHIQWKFLEDHYRLKGNWLRVIEIKTKEILTFYTGNLGIRTLFFALIPFAVLSKGKAFAHTKTTLIAGIGFLFTSIFPLLFLQEGVVWNSIQFWYYALLFANVLLVLGFFTLLKSKSRVLITAICIVLTIASLPAFLKTAHNKITSTDVVTHHQMSVLSQLSAKDTVLICPEDSLLFNSTVVQALSPASVLVSDPVQLSLVGADVSVLSELEEIFNRREAGTLQTFMDKNNATTVLCGSDDLRAYIATELQSLSEASVSGNSWQLFSR